MESSNDVIHSGKMSLNRMSFNVGWYIIVCYAAFKWLECDSAYNKGYLQGDYTNLKSMNDVLKVVSLYTALGTLNET